jgi:hypothetical protein
MKQHLNEILYVVLLGMAFTFFAFIDQIGGTPTHQNKAVNSVKSEPVNIENQIKDYTYSPLRYVNGYN